MERPARAARQPRGPRRSLLAAVVAAVTLAACGKITSRSAPTVNTDLAALVRLVKLPADVGHAEWQTSPMAEHGGDWWVAAVLDVPAAAMPQFLAGPGVAGTLDTPPGMQATASFAALKGLPGTRPLAGDRLSVTADLHGIEPYASSPLLHGHALQLSPTRVFVLLWTT